MIHIVNKTSNILVNQGLIERLEYLENKIQEYENMLINFDDKVFLKGEIYNAYNMIVRLIKKATNSIIIIDNYIDDSILEMLIKKQTGVNVKIITSTKSQITNLDIRKFNLEYPHLILEKRNNFHDRFIVIDKNEIYHVGASLKDLGKKCFAISKLNDKRLLNLL